MAGRGPAPKDPEQRRRRNVTSGFDELPAAGHAGPFPKLGAGYQVQLDVDDLEDDEPTTVVVAFRAETREWYAAWATSPMATRFTAVDWNRLRWVVAPLFDRFVRDPGKGLAGELRLQESLLGATVMDRQRLRVRVAEPDKPPVRARKPRGKSAAARRNRLRAV
ncbi:MAG: hypothetical protein ACR2NB_12080 [Solirubrobacteraceae bacterium]